MNIVCRTLRAMAGQVGWVERFDRIHPYLHTDRPVPLILAFADALADADAGAVRAAEEGWQQVVMIIGAIDAEVVAEAEAILAGAL